MKYFIASDIHGSAYYCRRLLEAYERKGLTDWSSSATSSITDRATTFPRTIIRRRLCHAQRKKDAILCVRGNCDSEVDQMVLEFPIMAPYAILTQEASSSMQLTATIITPTACRLQRATSCSRPHPPAGLGTLWTGQLLPQSRFGVLPKDGNPHSYLVWEDQTFTWKDMDGKASTN